MGWSCSSVVRGWMWRGGVLLVAAAGAWGQSGHPLREAAAVPLGQTMPVSLERGLRAGASQPGTPVAGYVMQRVPVSADAYLPRGAEVLGTVVQSSSASGSQPATITLRFDRLRWHGGVIPLRTRALAVASATEVQATEDPVNGIADRDVSGPANWTTEQVGGDQLMRSGWIGELDDTRMQKVGFADFNGVYGDPDPASGGSMLPRALGPFSADAQGLYGFDSQAVLKTGEGALSIAGPGKLVLRRGDEILLQVTPARAAD